MKPKALELLHDNISWNVTHIFMGFYVWCTTWRLFRNFC